MKRRPKRVAKPVPPPMAPKNVHPMLEPLPWLAKQATSVGQAQMMLASVSEHLARALEERDALIAYVLERAPDVALAAQRERMPESRRSLIRKLRIGAKGTEGHISAHLFMGFYDDGRLGELFVQLGRHHRDGPAGGGFHLAAKMASIALQHGAAYTTLTRQMRYQRDSSGGRPFGTDGPLKGTVTVHSLVDYIGRTIEETMEARTVPGTAPETQSQRQET